MGDVDSTAVVAIDSNAVVAVDSGAVAAVDSEVGAIRDLDVVVTVGSGRSDAVVAFYGWQQCKLLTVQTECI